MLVTRSETETPRPFAIRASALIEGLRKVLRGEVALTVRHAVHTHPSPACPQSPHLSQRQLEVLGLILQGLPNKLICRRLQLAQGTVKIHVSAVLKALNVETRTQAVVAATRLGLFDALRAARSP